MSVEVLFLIAQSSYLTASKLTISYNPPNLTHTPLPTPLLPPPTRVHFAGMHFRQLIIGSVLTLALSACASGVTTEKYAVHTNLTDPAKNTILFGAAERVMTRRLAAADVKNATVSVVPTGPNDGTATFVLPNKEAVDTVNRLTSDPFTFDIRIEKAPLSGTGAMDADNWIPTNLSGATLDWAQAIGNRSTGVISIELQFNPRGGAILSDIFKQNKGKGIGIFVRDLLVSKLKVAGTEPSARIVISGLPSQKIAEVFADDVNVGLHVNFTPISK